MRSLLLRCIALALLSSMLLSCSERVVIEEATPKVEFNSINVNQNSRSSSMESYSILENFSNEINSADNRTSRILIAELAQTANHLSPTHPYKISVVDRLIETFFDDVERNHKPHIIRMILLNNLCEIELSDYSASMLGFLLEKDARRLSAAELKILTYFEVEGYQGILDEVIKFAIDNPQLRTKTEYHTGRSRIGGSAPWTALILKSRYDEETLDVLLSLIENTNPNSRYTLFRDLEPIKNRKVILYLASHVFSDRQVNVIADSRTMDYVAWQAIVPLSKHLDSFPVSTDMGIRKKENRLEKIETVRLWLADELTPTEYSLVVGD